MKLGTGRVVIAGILLVVLMLASLLLMSDALQDSRRFGQHYYSLLVFNSAGLVLLLILIGHNVRNLLLQSRKKAPGVRMTVRMASMFCVLALAPLLVVYYFSLTFLHRGIDNWFDVPVEEALNDSLELSQLALEQRMKEILTQSKQMTEELAEFTDAALPFEIDRFRVQSGAQELTVYSRQGRFIASSSADTSTLVPNRPDETILLQVQQGDSYIGLDSGGSARLFIRAVVNIPQMGVEAEPRIMQIRYAFSARVNQLAETVESAVVKYRESYYLRKQLKFSFVLVLTLVLLFSVLTAVWAAILSARRLASPIRDLAQGTQAVADGDYSTQLPVPGNDELGFLVASFNEMTTRIAGAQAAVQRSQEFAETQRSYLENILARLSSGVLVLGRDKRVRTANISSGQILGSGVVPLIEQALSGIVFRFPYLEPFCRDIEQRIDRGEHDWHEQITLFGSSGRQILMCRGASLLLPGEDHSPVYVVVFDDITDLIQAQKNAAWSEMARRLAHEIKNPLTPIKLAAERIRQKFLGSVDPAQAETLDRMTHTIVQQVETMKRMVNTFTDYARPPSMILEFVNLNDLVHEAVDLYSNLDINVRLKLDLAEALPRIRADAGRLRQVFNNVLNNAFDAVAGQGNSVLAVCTSRVSENGVEFLEVRVRDSGPGVSGDIISSVFDPYVTSKPKGTGLGLAIVKKIVDEHGGVAWLENNKDGPGACAVIRLPILSASGAAAPPRSDMRGAV